MRSDLVIDLDTMAFGLDFPVDASRVLAIAEALIADGASIGTLVERYALSSQDAVHRVLSFILSRTASRGPGRTQLPPFIWTMVEHMLRPDDTTSVNLLNAIQVLAGYDVITDFDARVKDLVSSFLLASLTRSSEVQAIAISAIGQLDGSGALSVLEIGVRHSLRLRLMELEDSEDQLIRMELPSVADFIASVCLE